MTPTDAHDKKGVEAHRREDGRGNGGWRTVSDEIQVEDSQRR